MVVDHLGQVVEPVDRRSGESSKCAARCRATTVLPVPGPQSTMRVPWKSARMMAS